MQRVFSVTSKVIKDISQQDDYLRRWSIWLPFGWSIKLHEIVRADDDRCEHDHPWWFWRLILKGGYVEKINGVERFRKPFRIYYCPVDFKHRIERLIQKSSWTLCLCGPPVRRWGFYTINGWMHWQKFVQEAISNRVLWCDDGRIL